MKKTLLFALIAVLSSQSVLAEEAPLVVNCDVYDAIQAPSYDIVMSSCTDGTTWETYVEREGEVPVIEGAVQNDKGMSTVKVLNVTTTLPGLEKFGLPLFDGALSPSSKELEEMRQSRWIWIPWILLSGACYGNHHATISHLGRQCDGGRGGVRSMNAGFCGMGSSVMCRR